MWRTSPSRQTSTRARRVQPERQPVAHAHRPAPSVGVALGIGFATLCAIGVFFGAWSAFRAGDWTTRGVALLIALALLASLAMIIAGTWRLMTLRYVFTPTTLEVRSGAGRIRIRYDQIDRITQGTSAPDLPRSVLWPGAHLGVLSTAEDLTMEWRATSDRAAQLVLVGWPGRCCVLSPADPLGFRQQLVQHAQAAPFAPPMALHPRRGWLDRFASIDPWLRAIVAAALWVAGLGMVIATSDGRQVGPLLLIALGILLVNTAVAGWLAPRQVGPARLLVGVALLTVVGSIFW
jgi:hypothetical protein